jgi:nucleotide-binding universal stress UspA family protein
MSELELKTNKNILIAVDESENARRAVSYVGELLGGLSGFQVMVLHVIPDPEEDYFPNQKEKDNWLVHTKQKVDAMLLDYQQMLIKAGFSEDSVSIKSTLRYCPSMAECILAEREETRYDTIVVGRHGVSRREEFLFGSISSKIVNHAENCTIWVVR